MGVGVKVLDGVMDGVGVRVRVLVGVTVGVTDGDDGAQYVPHGFKSSPGKGPTGPEILLTDPALAHVI